MKKAVDLCDSLLVHAVVVVRRRLLDLNLNLICAVVFVFAGNAIAGNRLLGLPFVVSSFVVCRFVLSTEPDCRLHCSWIYPDQPLSSGGRVQKDRM